MEELKFSKGTLTQKELDVVAGMINIFAHAIKKYASIIETHYAMEYMKGDEYKAYCKIYGKVATDAEVKRQAIRMVRGNERMHISRLLDTCKNLKAIMDKFTDTGMKAHSEEVDDIWAFDAIEHDSNLLAYIYGIISNIDIDNAEVKLVSTLKAMAKCHRVSDNLLSKLEVKLQ